MAHFQHLLGIGACLRHHRIVKLPCVFNIVFGQGAVHGSALRAQDAHGCFRHFGLIRHHVFAGAAVNAEHGPHQGRVLRDHRLRRGEDHIQATHGGTIRIFDQFPNARGKRKPRARFGTHIGINIAAGEHDVHFAKGHADAGDIAHCHAVLAEPFQDEHFLSGTRPNRNTLAAQPGNVTNARPSLGNHAHAAITEGANHHNGFTRRSAQRTSSNTEAAEINAACYHRIFAIGRAIKSDDFNRKPRRREALIEMRCH